MTMRLKLSSNNNFKSNETRQEITDALKEHLEPNQKKIDSGKFFTVEDEIEKLHKPLSSQNFQTWNATTINKLQWEPAAAMAYCMNLSEIDPYTPENLEKRFTDNELNRYDIPSSQHTTKSHKISLFGTDYTGIGDYPFQIEMDTDINLENNFTDFYRDLTYYQLLKTKGEVAFRNKLDEDIQFFKSEKNTDIAHKLEIMRNQSLEEIEKNISSKLEQNYTQQIKIVSGMLRYLDDFIGTPVKSVIGEPDLIEVKSPIDVNLKLDKNDIQTITKRPSVDVTRYTGEILSKQNYNISEISKKLLSD